MNDLATALVSGLLRTALALCATFLIASILLRFSSTASPGVHRAMWIVVLLQGWLLGRYALNISWHESARFQPHRATQDALLETSTLTPLPPGSGDAADTQRTAEPNRAHEDDALAESFVWNWRVLLAVGWLGGCGVLLLRSIAGYGRFLRNLPLGKASPSEDEAVWRQLLAERKIRSTIPLRITEDLGPMLCRVPGGYRVFVPDSLWRELSAEARLAVLRHELAHYERGDLWKSLVAHLLALPQWFNPFAWRAVRHFDEAAEWACDDAVRRAYPEIAPEYGRALLSLGAARAPRVVLNTAARGRGLALRIRRIVATHVPADALAKRACLLGVSLALLLAGGTQVKLVARDAADLQSTNAAAAEEAAYAKAAEAMLETAKATYEATAAGYDAGTITLPELYLWSRRWLEAERTLASTKEDELAALAQHWQRMRTTLRKVGALYFAGSKGGEAEKYHGAEFYLAEAEMWLVDAGGAVPDRVD